ncbi:insecticidal delta-endotoxin Cry8Ea1 family protein [Bacillus thuringiensis]|uniref:insecticidal delta-endotoxin Cry8Ea1 family protein n=1 Tax=Bacillus thuringiensis TaxID=1428 RepID=UPI003015D1EF
MKNKRQKALHMTIAASVLVTMYVPAVNFSFVQEKQEQGLEETQVAPFNEWKEKMTGNQNLDNSRIWNPYKGVDHVKFINALNSNVRKPILTDAVKNEGENEVPVLIKGVIVMGLSLAPPPLPMLGTVVDLFQFTDGKTDDAWSITVENINKTIDSKIEQYHSYLMSSGLVALGSSLREYKRVLDIYETNKLTRVEDPAAGVREQFRIANDKAKAFIAKLQHPQNQGDTRYNVLTLPLFAQAANLHLALLRDAIVCDWGIDSNQLQGYKDELKKLIMDYTNYINKAYKEGLEQEKNKVADYSDPESYIQAGKVMCQY